MEGLERLDSGTSDSPPPLVRHTLQELDDAAASTESVQKAPAAPSAMNALHRPVVIAFLDARSLGRYETAARDFRSRRATAMPGVRLRGSYINYSGRVEQASMVRGRCPTPRRSLISSSFSCRSHTTRA
jgi:hypothetical protein